jgi:hypothetical protein
MSFKRFGEKLTISLLLFACSLALCWQFGFEIDKGDYFNE